MGPQSFAALIRAHRRAARMTVRELAAASGVSVRAIGDMERGQSAARQGTLDALARALTLTAAERADLASAAGAVRSAPAGALPRDVPDFTGRRAEIDRLTRFLRHGGPVVVHGPPGVGKTALAVHVAGRFFGAVRFLDCRRTDPAPRRAASDPVVLDDAVDPQQVVPSLPGPVVVTSRGPLAGLTDVVRIPLRPLPAEESVALLAAITGGQRDAATAAVAEHCGHLPLALRIAGNRLAGRPGWTMAHLATRLADEDRRLPTLAAGDLSMEATLARAYERLSAPARATGHRLARDPDADADRGTVAELIEHGLLTDDGRFHPLVRVFFTGRTAG